MKPRHGLAPDDAGHDANRTRHGGSRAGVPLQARRRSRVEWRDVAAELAALAARREQIVSDAFRLFQERHPSLAEGALEYIGGERRAAHWMSAPRRAGGGRIPYELLAEGDEDGVWELLQAAFEQSHA